MNETKYAPLECKMSLFSALGHVQPLCPNRVVEQAVSILAWLILVGRTSISELSFSARYQAHN